MSHALSLHRLQETDSQTDKARRNLQSIVAQLEDNAEVNQAKLLVETTANLLDQAKIKMREMDQEVTDQRIKIEQMESSLYGGNVHNPKELQDIQNDVAALKRHYQLLEERLLVAMEEHETMERAYREACSAFDQIKIESLQNNQSLVGEQERLEKEIKRKEAERLAIINGLPQDLVSRYDTLRKDHRGIAVAKIEDNTCSACGSKLTSALSQNSRLEDRLIFCPTCGRILYGG